MRNFKSLCHNSIGKVFQNQINFVMMLKSYAFKSLYLMLENQKRIEVEYEFEPPNTFACSQSLFEVCEFSFAFFHSRSSRIFIRNVFFRTKWIFWSKYILKVVFFKRFHLIWWKIALVMNDIILLFALILPKLSFASDVDFIHFSDVFVVPCVNGEPHTSFIFHYANWHISA